MRVSEMLKTLKQNIANIPGWRTQRKIVVFESDDWGSLRMSSTDAYQWLNERGVNLGKGVEARYNKYDTLASSDDLSLLYEVLNSVKDGNGEPAKFTALSVVANPNFPLIVADDFQKYYYEPFTETLKRYNQEDALLLWREGIDKGLFEPQFHGREHLNVFSWLAALKGKDRDACLGFEREVWGHNREPRRTFQAAFDLIHRNHLEKQHEIITDGLRLFSKIHGYKATYFVPPNGHFCNELEETASKGGIKYMCTPKIFREVLGGGKTRLHIRFLGHQNKHGQYYLTRNAFFEPSDAPNDQVYSCLEEIDTAFRFGKPAIISTHRINYIGGHYVSNRDNSLRALAQLLRQITERWPDVSFMTSSQLGNLIAGSDNR